ncbi:tenascin-R-like [Elysia marginata]|uniref:Tenascin-R-like n=1 Tax=Elysia marginata TaxID=1093978 RepID=A0AAV4IN25_9GAST|nr:tenascin-R-like [Elysia marginata]
MDKTVVLLLLALWMPGTVGTNDKFSPTGSNNLKASRCTRGMKSSYPGHDYKLTYEPNADVFALCDVKTDNGGWIIFQRRKFGNANFEKNYNSYVNGFGDLFNDYWLGLNALRNLTSSGTWEMRIDVKDGSSWLYRTYTNFRIGTATEKYG